MNNTNFEFKEETAISPNLTPLNIINSNIKNNNIILKNTKLFDYQNEVVDFVSIHKNVIVGLDIGLGKTLSSIASAINVEREINRIINVLIICPNSLKKHWGDEIEKFTDKEYVIINGDYKKRKLQHEHNKMFTIINYELVRGKDFNIIKNKKWDMIICDEVTRIKSYKTITNKNISKLNAEYKLGLSGRPIENRPDELFSIMKFINKNVFSSYWDFVSNYFIMKKVIMGSKSWNEIVGYKNLNDMKDKIKYSFIQKKKRDVLKDLPKRTEKNYYIDMTSEQKSIYYRIETEVLEQFNKKNPLTKLIELRQICNDPRTIGINHSGGKIDEIINIISEIGDKKIIIFSEFVKFLNLLSNELKNKGIKHVIITGENVKDRDKNIDIFKSSSINILLSSKVLSYGANLQEASVIINVELPWSPAVLEQRIGRIERYGQKNNILVINMITKNTVEEKVYQVIKEKNNTISKIIDLDNKQVEFIDDLSFIKNIFGRY